MARIGTYLTQEAYDAVDNITKKVWEDLTELRTYGLFIENN